MFYVNGQVTRIQKGTQIRICAWMWERVDPKSHSCGKTYLFLERKLYPRLDSPIPKALLPAARIVSPAHQRIELLIRRIPLSSLARPAPSRATVEIDGGPPSPNTVTTYACHDATNPTALFPARDEHRRRVMPIELCGCFQGVGQVNRRREALALPFLRAGVMARCPPASGGDATPWATGTTDDLLLPVHRTSRNRCSYASEGKEGNGDLIAGVISGDNLDRVSSTTSYLSSLQLHRSARTRQVPAYQLMPPSIG